MTRAFNSAGEWHLHTVQVVGSIPTTPTEIPEAERPVVDAAAGRRCSRFESITTFITTGMAIEDLPSGIAPTKCLNTADELLAHLLPHTGPLYRLGTDVSDADGGTGFTWIFRGQSNSKWDLAPSALRESAIHDFLPHRGRVAWTPAERRRLELKMIMDFVAQADQHGFPIPDEAPQIRDGRLAHTLEARAINEPDHSAFPPPALLATFALAQHYGVPTRLLDWTRKPLVAAYFAADGAARQRKPTQQITFESIVSKLKNAEKIEPDLLKRIELSQDESNFVRDWSVATDTARFSVFALRTSERLCELDPRIHVVTSATALNPNLRAQGGLFTLVQPTTDIDPLDLRAVLTKVGHTISAEPDAGGSVPQLIEFTVPTTEAKPLLGKLTALGVSQATVYPGLKSVVESIKHRMIRDR